MKCSICNKKSKLLWESVFDNNYLICVNCKDEEKKHKDYYKSTLAIKEAEGKGNFDFAGIGIPLDLLNKKC